MSHPPSSPVLAQLRQAEEKFIVSQKKCLQISKKYEQLAKKMEHLEKQSQRNVKILKQEIIDLQNKSLLIKEENLWMKKLLKSNNVNVDNGIAEDHQCDMEQSQKILSLYRSRYEQQINLLTAQIESLNESLAQSHKKINSLEKQIQNQREMYQGELVEMEGLVEKTKQQYKTYLQQSKNFTLETIKNYEDQIMEMKRVRFSEKMDGGEGEGMGRLVGELEEVNSQLRQELKKSNYELQKCLNNLHQQQQKYAQLQAEKQSILEEYYLQMQQDQKILGSLTALEDQNLQLTQQNQSLIQTLQSLQTQHPTPKNPPFDVLNTFNPLAPLTSLGPSNSPCPLESHPSSIAQNPSSSLSPLSSPCPLSSSFPSSSPYPPCPPPCPLPQNSYPSLTPLTPLGKCERRIPLNCVENNCGFGGHKGETNTQQNVEEEKKGQNDDGGFRIVRGKGDKKEKWEKKGKENFDVGIKLGSKKGKDATKIVVRLDEIQKQYHLLENIHLPKMQR